MIDETRVLLEGIISVEAAVKGNSREIFNVYVDKEKVKKKDRKIIRFLKFLSDNNIHAELCERELIDSYANEASKEAGNTNGGVIAFCGSRRYTPLSDLILKMRKNNGYAVFLDGIEDPYNFGYCIRSMYAAGVCGIIVPERNWTSAANVCARSSAGASELCDISIMQKSCDESMSDEDFCAYLKQKGIPIVCAAKNSVSIPYTEFSPDFPFVLFIGGEKRGISKAFMASADKILHVPYSNSLVRYSLPTATVAAVMGFEFQNKKTNQK